MNKIAWAVIITSGVLLSACASQTGWTPTVDSYNDPNAFRINQDMAECKALASQASGGTLQESAIGAAAGGLMGAAGGAALGAVAGNAGTGAALGVITGGLGGAGMQGYNAEMKYKNAFNNCMSGRGHHVLR